MIFVIAHIYFTSIIPQVYCEIDVIFEWYLASFIDFKWPVIVDLNNELIDVIDFLHSNDPVVHNRLMEHHKYVPILLVLYILYCWISRQFGHV